MRKRAALIVILLSLALSGCSTYETPGGGTRLGEPSMCGTEGVCPLILVAGLAGVCALAIAH